MRVTIYHNPKCGTSRNTLQILREAGFDPEVVEYLKTPLSRAQLADFAQQLGGAADLLRTKEALATTLDLHNADDSLILDAIAAHPILLNRPLVVTEKGAKICRPAALVLTLLGVEA